MLLLEDSHKFPFYFKARPDKIFQIQQDSEEHSCQNIVLTASTKMMQEGYSTGNYGFLKIELQCNIALHWKSATVQLAFYPLPFPLSLMPMPILMKTSTTTTKTQHLQ